MKLLVYAAEVFAIDVGVDLRCRDIYMAQHLLNSAKIGAAFEKADAYLSTQPAHRPVLPFPAAAAMGNAHTSLTDCTGNSAVPPSNPLAFNNELAEAGGNRTHRPGG